MPKKDTLINIRTAFIAVVFLFLCLELFVRLNPRFYCDGYRPAKNAKLVYELQPGYKIRTLKAEISSQGLNDRYFTIAKPTGVYRIAAIGDSTSFGWKVGAANSFPKILERMLNDGKDRHRRFEVINFSVPGYNAAQELEVLKEKAVRFNPDMVILIYYGNDTESCNYIQSDLSAANFLYNRSYIIRYLLMRIDYKIKSMGLCRSRKIWISFKKNILGMFYYDRPIYPYPGLEEATHIKGHSPSAREEVPSKYWDMIGFENYRIHLSQILDILKKNNIELISAGFFDPESLRINEAAGIKNICNFNGLLSRDGISYDEIKLENDRHMGIRGHTLCAGYLCEQLKDVWKAEGLRN